MRASCWSAPPDGAWTGARHLVSWTDNSSGPIPGHETLLDITDAAAESLEWRELLPEGDLSSPPRVAAGPQRSVVISGVWTGEVHDFTVHVLDDLGQSVGEPLSLTRPDDAHLGSADVIAGPEGFSIWAGYWDIEPNLLHWRLDALAQPLSLDPELIPSAEALRELDAVRRPGGHVVAAETVDVVEYTNALALLVFDESELLDRVDIPLPTDAQWIARPKLAQRDHTTYVLYQLGFADRVELHLRHLDCT